MSNVLTDTTNYNYSEIFYSIQGEGYYTGVPTTWLRFFLCNLQCNGFGQEDPTNELTHKLPYKDIDVSQYNTMEELPVFEYGCDSSYSWAKKFKDLQRQGTPEQIAERIETSMKNEWNPQGLFVHPNGTHQHMCFTGGEPLMSHGQECSVEVMKYFKNKKNIPLCVTYETNGTQPLMKKFIKFWDPDYSHRVDVRRSELFFSISPKLFNVSGELEEKAIKPEIVKEYYKLSKNGQLKFVLTPHKEAWDELEMVIDCYRSHGIHYPIWIMPVGATVEGQKLVDGDVARMAFERGYNVSARVHTYLWGNLIGV